MKITEHYLIEDLEMVTEHRDNLLKVCMDIQRCAAEGNSIHNDDFLQNINQSLKVLQALNAKKLQRDEMIASENIRRSYF